VGGKKQREEAKGVVEYSASLKSHGGVEDIWREKAMKLSTREKGFISAR